MEVFQTGPQRVDMCMVVSTWPPAAGRSHTVHSPGFRFVGGDPNFLIAKSSGCSTSSITRPFQLPVGLRLVIAVLRVNMGRNVNFLGLIKMRK